MKILNTNIDIKSMFRKKPKEIDDNFGCALICGYMGSGKTYLGVYIICKYIEPNRKIYTNIKSLKIPNREIEYFEKITEITSNFELDRVFLIDEISKKYTKESPQDKPFYSWLQQSRKCRRTVMLITQEYLQVPPWLRGAPRFVYTTSKIKFLPLFKTDKGIAQLNDDKQWVIGDILETYIYKRNKYICNYYDTMEPVPIL